MKFFVSLIVTTVLWWVFAYWLLCIPTYWPMVSVHAFIYALLFTGVTAVGDYFDNGFEDVSKQLKTSGWSAIGLVLVMLIISFSGSGCFRASDYRSLGNVTVSEKPMEVADVRHIRIVPMESAAWIGNQVIGKDNLGSLYELNNYHIQRVKDSLYWVAPLDFRSFWAWRGADHVSPGYVMVSAEDLNAAPVLVQNREMRYLNSASFGQNLYRHLYQSGLQGYSFDEAIFEIDDSGKPFYVVPLKQPTIGFDGMKMGKVAILDPETGHVAIHAPNT